MAWLLSKKIISHNLAILEGVGTKKIDCAHFYLTNINLDVGHQCLWKVSKCKFKYSLHWVLRPASVIGIEVAKPNGGR